MELLFPANNIHWANLLDWLQTGNSCPIKRNRGRRSAAIWATY